MRKNGIAKGRVISYAAQIAEGMMFLHSKVRNSQTRKLITYVAGFRKKYNNII